MRALVERDADTTDGTNSINERRYLYYNAAWQIVEEHVDAGFASASDPVTIDRIVQNIWGLRYIDDLVLRRVDANYPGSGLPDFSQTAAGDIDWEQYLTDHQFSVVAAVGRTGTLAFRVAYDAFGEARHLPAKDINGDGKVDRTDTTLAQNASGKKLGQPGYNPDADWNRDGKITSADVAQFGSRSYVAALPQGQLAQPGSATQPAATTTTAAANAARAANARSDFNIGFSGYRFNGDIGAYTVRFRHYDPTPGMCRWLERDPAGYQDGPSLYSYLGRNPMAGTDPYGLAEGGQGGQSGDWIDIKDGSIKRVRVDNTWVRGKDGVVTGSVHIAINDTSSPELHKRNRYFYNPDTDTFVNEHGHQLSTRDIAKLRGNEQFKRQLKRRLDNLKALAPGKLRFQTFEHGTGKTAFTNTSMLMISALLMLYTASDAVANSPHYARFVSAIKNGSPGSANQEAENIRDLLLDNGMMGLSEGWWELWQKEISPLMCTR